MPSSRAILVDIENLGLDPTKPHSTISATGHLADSQRNVISEKVVELADEAPVISDVAECVEQVEQEQIAIEQVAEVTQHVDDTVTNEGEEVTKKKGRKSSKNSG